MPSEQSWLDAPGPTTTPTPERPEPRLLLVVDLHGRTLVTFLVGLALGSLGGTLATVLVVASQKLG